MAETPLQKYFDNDSQCDIFDQFKENTSKAEIRDLWAIPDFDNSLKINTIPAVTVELLNDPIAAAINTHCPSEIVNRRKHQNYESLTIDDFGIRSLINDKCYRSAIALTSRLLSNYGQGLNQKGQGGIKHTIHSLQLWQTRISLLIKIGELEIARKEAEPFGQLSNHDMFYDFIEEQQFKSKKGSLPSFSFRLLLAYELPYKLNRIKEALHNLVPILSTSKKIYTFFKNLNCKTEMNFWKDRVIKVLCCIINCAAHLKNFDLALQTYEKILELPDLSDDLKFELYSFWGRTYLQSGDILNAEKTFSLQEANTPERKLTVLVNKGLLAVAQNDYNEAFKTFQNAREIDKNNIMVLNNLAVCYLYNGNLHEAIKVFEQAIHDDPKNNLHETLILNCATLYELESNDSKKKKIDLLKIVSANRADLEMNVELCLKL
ncbi:hypothetical protein PVAND_005232 [Polypedilum vanderplanki]|uniref:Uncharacterized protein n=1 Tax=Polypedilum vanderplanki TaxID=319348 RepID=A0A9J6BZB5_POLVA|nr:hypothetical protein PVAND_005232 [Polypedilum vanderplanki]